MARTVAVIQAQINAFISANPNLTYQDENNITRNLTYNTSKRAFWNALTFIVASAIAVLEQLIDLYENFIEGQVAQSAAASILWIQAKMFQFQYDATNPQILQLNGNLSLSYPIVDTTKQIISGCAISTSASNVVNIKVATGNPFTMLDGGTPNGPQQQAAQAYINLMGDAGITYNVTSAASDKLYIAANIYYNGQYSAVIQNNVISALNTFLQNLAAASLQSPVPNNPAGILKVSDIADTIRNVAGVNDVVLNTVIVRPDSPTPADPTANSAATSMVLNSGVQTGFYQYNSAASPTGAGYIIQETVATYTWADTLVFNPQ